jgi:hypothetical protein
LRTDAHAGVARRIAAAALTLVRGPMPHTGRPPLLLATRLDRCVGPSVEEQVRTALQAVGWTNSELMPNLNNYCMIPLHLTGASLSCP